jgi:hypothetical protein
MKYQDFSDQLTEIAPLLGWRLDGRAIQSLWRRLPDELDDACLMDAVNDAVDAQARVPAMLMEFYKQRRRLAVQTAVTNQPQLSPASHEGRPCEEYVKLCRTMRERKEGILPDFKSACQHGNPCQKPLDPYNPPPPGHLPQCLCLAEWEARPLTAEDWRRGKRVEPAQLISSATEGRTDANGNPLPPPPDPKERDTVWMPEGEAVWM